MLDRSKLLACHGVNPERWADRWGIEPFTAACQDCGATTITSVPFACGELRGLMAPPCEACGNEVTPYCVVGARRDLLEILRE